MPKKAASNDDSGVRQRRTNEELHKSHACIFCARSYSTVQARVLHMKNKHREQYDETKSRVLSHTSVLPIDEINQNSTAVACTCEACNPTRDDLAAAEQEPQDDVDVAVHDNNSNNNNNKSNTSRTKKRNNDNDDDAFDDDNDDNDDDDDNDDNDADEELESVNDENEYGDDDDDDIAATDIVNNDDIVQSSVAQRAKMRYYSTAVKAPAQSPRQQLPTASTSTRKRKINDDADDDNDSSNASTSQRATHVTMCVPERAQLLVSRVCSINQCLSHADVLELQVSPVTFRATIELSGAATLLETRLIVDKMRQSASNAKRTLVDVLGVTLPHMAISSRSNDRAVFQAHGDTMAFGDVPALALQIGDVLLVSAFPGHIVARFNYRLSQIEIHYIGDLETVSFLAIVVPLHSLNGIGLTSLLDGGVVLTLEPYETQPPTLQQSTINADGAREWNTLSRTFNQSSSVRGRRIACRFAAGAIDACWLILMQRSPALAKLKPLVDCFIVNPVSQLNPTPIRLASASNPISSETTASTTSATSATATATTTSATVLPLNKPAANGERISSAVPSTSATVLSSSSSSFIESTKPV